MQQKALVVAAQDPDIPGKTEPIMEERMDDMHSACHEGLQNSGEAIYLPRDLLEPLCSKRSYDDHSCSRTGVGTLTAR